MIQANVNKTDLVVKLKLDTSDEIFIRKVISLFTYDDNYVEIIDDVVKFPWPVFQENLYDFVTLCQLRGQNIMFDDFSQKLISNYVNLQSNRKNASIFLDYSYDEISEVLLKNHFYRNLTNEQYRDVKTLLSLRHGANFSVPGAGKTTTLLAVNNVLSSMDMATKMLVICPRNAFISWEEEVDQIYKGFRSITRLQDINYATVKTAFQSNDYLLINYEKFRKDTKSFLPFFFNNKVHLVLDESHRIKSGESNLSYAEINRLADLSSRRDILSGTPMPQCYLDLQPQFYFLWRKKIIPESNLDASVDSSKKIHEVIKPLYVRTTKGELDLPDPIFHRIDIQMGPIQTEIYELLRSETRRKFSGLPREHLRTLRRFGSMVVRLMQAATNPMLLSSEDEYFNETLEVSESTSLWDAIFQYSRYEKPAKFVFLSNYISDYLSKNDKNKVVVWSYFIKNIKILEKQLQSFSPTTIFGAIPTGDEEDLTTREGRIKRFTSDPECKVLIANPQACGEGISLHRACHHAIYLDRNFNAAHYLQSVDRIHRLGLSKDTTTEITYLVSTGSIDEVIMKRLSQKTERMADVLNDTSLKKLAIDPYDISFDDSLGLEGQDIDELLTHLSAQA